MATNFWKTFLPLLRTVRPPGNAGFHTVRIVRPQPMPPQSPLSISSPLGRFIMVAVIGGVSGTSFYCLLEKSKDKEGSPAVITFTSTPSSEPHQKRKLTAREKRFIKFASVEYDGQIYMTPQDFLESVVEGEPRPRFKRKRLTPKEVDEMLQKLPKISKSSEFLFRNLGNNGLISFSEYLFLLTILIKPQSGFKIAFAMLDQDGNERIDKEEFKVLETVFSSAAKERKQMVKHQSDAQPDVADENKSLLASSSLVFDDSDYGLHRTHSSEVDTTLLVYFFGKKGSAQLRFDDFRRFMDNLQTEVLHMEFHEFAKGTLSITELDFARILLRFTFLNSEEYETILERLIERLHKNADEVTENGKKEDFRLKGITFEEFKDFCLFLNNLDDFEIAMRMYTLADKAIAPEEFSRAVAICTGRQLSSHVVSTVFQIFDNDGDGLLTYQEFIAMMKDRINRGLKTFSRQEGWTGFKKCVKLEVRAGH